MLVSCRCGKAKVRHTERDVHMFFFISFLSLECKLASWFGEVTCVPAIEPK